MVAASIPARRLFAHLVRRLEIPDCGCPVFVNCDADNCHDYRKHGRCDCRVRLLPPCPHVRAAGHFYSVEEWETILLQFARREYADPPPPACYTKAVTRAARVSALADRESQKVGLWHPADIIAGMTDKLGMRVSPGGSRSRPIGFVVLGGR